MNAAVPAVRKGRDPDWLAERSSERHVELDGRVPAQLDVWPGHFPGFLVVPGVLQLDWVIRLCAARFGSGAPHAIDNLKFKAPLRPDQPFTLRLDFGEADRRVDFRIAHGASIFATGRLQFRGAGA